MDKIDKAYSNYELRDVKTSIGWYNTEDTDLLATVTETMGEICRYVFNNCNVEDSMDRTHICLAYNHIQCAVNELRNLSQDYKIMEAKNDD